MGIAKLITVLALLGAAPARAYELPSSTGTHRVVFSSEQGDFNENTRIINLQGQVQVDELGVDEKLIKTIKARRLTVYSSSSTVYSPEDFVLLDSSGATSGGRGVFNYFSDTAEVDNCRSVYQRFFLSGRKVEMSPQRNLYKKAEITTCDESPPDFRIKASRIYLYPGRYFLSYNNVFYLGPVPIFYFPVLYKPLIGGTPFVSSFYIGESQRKGFFVKSVYAYKFNPATRGKLYLDYFSRLGFGTGGELDYREPDKSIVNVSMYRIHESGAGADRWGVNGGYWYKFSPLSKSDPANYYSQSAYRLLSDPAFNNDFFKTNPFAISPDEQASIAFTRATNTTVTRVSAATLYTRSADLTRFIKSSESAPRLDFQRLPFTLSGIPVLHSFTGFFESAKDPGVRYYQRRSGGTWTASKAVPLARGLTLLPSVFYNQSLYLATSAQTTNQWIGRYGTGANMRYDRSWGSLDLTYAYQARMVANRFGRDRYAADKGNETKSLYSQLFVMPSYNSYFKAYTTYDLRDGVGGSLSKRLAPVNLELYHAPRKNLNIYVQEAYKFGRGNDSLVGQVYLGDEKNYFGLGVANFSTQSNAYVVNQMMGFRVPWAPSWRAEGVLRYRIIRFAQPADQRLLFFEKSIILYKDFHDFHTTWDLRVRRGVKEFFFLIRLKMNDASKRDALEEQSRNYWHPWRKDGDLSD
ncbi:MAG: LPS export ABC transporter periplasmic protein LptC [Elusimicrobiales bacterium]|jgi:LPS-assembly protein